MQSEDVSSFYLGDDDVQVARLHLATETGCCFFLCRREMLPNAWCQGPMDEPTWQEKKEDTREGQCR